MSIQSGQTYNIVNVKSGTAIDLSGTDERTILGWQRHSGENQKWVVEQHQDGRWTFRNVKFGTYLGYGGNTQEGAALVASQDATKWDIYKDDHDSSVYRIFVPGANKINIDLSDNGNPRDGTPVTLWGQWEGKHQTWRFEQ